MDQIVDLNSHLHHIDEKSCCALAESFHNYKQNDSRSLIIMSFPAAAIPKGASIASAGHSVGDKRFLNDGYCMTILDGHGLRCYMEIVRDHNGVGWVVGSLRMCHAF